MELGVAKVQEVEEEGMRERDAGSVPLKTLVIGSMLGSKGSRRGMEK